MENASKNENNVMDTENRIAELREETEALEKQLRNSSMKLDMARQRIKALEDTNQALQRAIIAQALAMDALTDAPPIEAIAVAPLPRSGSAGAL